MWVKSRFVLRQPRCYNLLNQKMDKKICDFEVHIFVKTPSLDDKLLGNFQLQNSIILAEDLIRWKIGFEIFFI